MIESKHGKIKILDMYGKEKDRLIIQQESSPYYAYLTIEKSLIPALIEELRKVLKK